MLHLSSLPLRAKIFALTLGIAGVGISLGAGVLLVRQQHALQQGAQREAAALAATAAEYAKGALAFEDREGAATILKQLSAHPDVRSALVLDVDDKRFAAYGDEHARGISAEHAIVHGGSKLGTLRLTLSRQGLEREMEENTLGTVALCLLILSACALATARVQRLVTDPVLELVSSMRRVAQDNRLDEQLSEERSDEVGSLYRGFNAMLMQLRLREEERDQSEARLRALIRALPDLVYVISERAELVEILCGHDSLLLPPDATPGMRLADHMPGAAGERLRHAVQIALEHHEAVRFDYDLMREGRAYRAEAAVSSLPLHDATDARLMLVVVRDLTERRELELQLLQAQKLDAVGQLAGGIAHDFNNLLAGILGFAELIRDGSARVDRNWLAGEIIRVAEQAAQLTSRLLGFARHTKAQSAPTDLNELIVRVGSILERTVDRRIAVRLEKCSAQCWAKADAAQLESAVLNLALNARDAMPKGGTLTIAVSRIELDLTSLEGRAAAPDQAQPEPGSYVQLAVRDTGSGIDEDVRRKMFEPFFTTKGPGKGSGLGLAAVLGAARAHHGYLTVESQLQIGTTFKLLLPALAQEPVLAANDIGVEAPHTRGSAQILLVDDDDAVSSAGRLLLEDQGYTVSLAKNGREAIDLLQRQPRRFDLVIMDMIMPEMSGSEAVPLVRKLAPHAPILIVSGYSAATQSAVEADGFLQKPYTRAELSRQVDLLLATRAAQTPEARDARGGS
jgi:signal transduction histidine kinase/ActR/RegA family two-component response regulator